MTLVVLAGTEPAAAYLGAALAAGFVRLFGVA